MNPLKLTLKGFIGVRNGTGKEAITLDLEIAGALIALCGPNGAGKSTILDNLTPYRLQASRASSYSPGAFSYFDHTYGEALKELDWEYAGVRYRSSIVIHNGKRKQECYLLSLKSDKYQPYTAPDGTISDGKTSTYDHCVEAILGSPELFFTAAFACQGRKALSDYPNADIKALMADLLGANQILDLGTQADTVAKGIRLRLITMRERIGAAEKADQEYQITTQDLANAQQEREPIARQLESATAKVAAQQQELANERSNEQRAHELRRQRQQIRERIDAEVSDSAAAASREKASIARSIDQITNRIEDIRNKLEANTKTIAAAEARIAKNALLMQRQPDIDLAIMQLPGLEAALNEGNASLALLEEQAIKKHHAEMRLSALSTELDGAKKSHSNTLSRCGLISEVPCYGLPLQKQCKLLAEANTARDSLPGLEEKLATLAEFVKEVKEEANKYAAIDEQIVTAKKNLGAVTAQHRAAAALAAMQGQIDVAEAAMVADRQAISDAVAYNSTAEQSITEGEKEISRLTEQLRETLTNLEGASKKKIQQYTEEMLALPPIQEQSRLLEMESQLSDLKKWIAKYESRKHELTATIATLEERARRLLVERDEAAKDRAKVSELENDLAHWTLLGKALGRDGIVALCIDDAGPTLANLANDLLSACYGHRFSVRIDTQRETAKGAMAETFDIKVLDSEQDAIKSISDTSGGERIWINECITRAMALYQAQSSGRHYECLFSDESDGALDPEKKRQFARMKRRVLELGGYRREFFITHSDEVRSVADHCIDLTTREA